MSGDEAPEKVVEDAAVAEAPAAADAVSTEPKEKIDLSKPVPRPDKAELAKKVAALDEEVKVFIEQIAAIDAKIADAKSSGGDQSSDELREARVTLKSLRERKEAVMRDRAEVAAKQKAAKASLETKMAANKSLRSELKFTSPEDIEKRIAELEKKQSTTSMSLKDEKVLLKEIEMLKASKKQVTQLSATSDSITSERNSTKTISEQLSLKHAELGMLKKKIEEQKEILDGLNSENSERRAVLPALRKEREGVRKAMKAKNDVINALRTEFRALEKKFYDYQRAANAARKDQRDAEAAQRKVVEEERKKEREAEELKRVPYEEEMELCRYLVTFLKDQYLGGGKADNKENPTEDDDDAAAAPASEFEGLVLGGKKALDEAEDEYVSLGKASGKKKGRGKKRGGQRVQEKLTILPEMFEYFGTLNLEAPATLSSIPTSIEELKAKEKYFSVTARGAVESIREKRNKAGAKADPRKDRTEDAAETKKKPDSANKNKGQPKTFDATKAADELFPSLSPAGPKKVAPPADPVEESKGE